MLRIKTSPTIGLDKCYYIERRREWKVFGFTFRWWQPLGRAASTGDAARFAANIQRYTHENLQWWN